jgi:hypothetical protein
MVDHGPPHEAPALPTTPDGCRERLAELAGEIASIRIQIATTDIRRQTERRTLDPAWFHRAKTALRMKQAERTAVAAQLAHLAGAQPGRSREHFKDALIEVLREDYDNAAWEQALERARARQNARDGVHG